MLHYRILERFARDKHSSLLSQLISYKENDVAVFTTLYFLCNEYNKLDYAGKAGQRKNSCLLGQFKSYEEIKYCEYGNRGCIHKTFFSL